MARENAGLRPSEAADRSGISRQVWSDWEHSRRVVGSAQELRRICDLLQADPGWLLGVTDLQRPWPAEHDEHKAGERKG
jgi:transcriptional regulator with XRE-family HTH domain